MMHSQKNIKLCCFMFG